MTGIALTGGGTGGHIYPGLAVALELKKLLSGSDYKIFWIGSSSGMDRSLVEDAGIEFFGVPSGKLRRYFSLRTVADFFKVIAGFFASRKILKKQKVSILFSKGGFVSVPPCAAAASLKIPVFTHESDFSPGLATKINTRFVSDNGRIFTAYEDTLKFFPEKIRSRIIVTGNPVRSVFRYPDPAKGRAFFGLKEETRILLVLGGSQGASEINDLVRACLGELTEIYTVIHQTGPNLLWEIPSNEKYKAIPYIKEEMPHVMAAAELIFGRSGAGIWEWAVTGKPMLLLPLSGAGTRGDQVENAEYFQRAGAAGILPPPAKENGAIDPKEFLDAVKSFANNEEKRKKTAAASAAIGDKDASRIIAKILYEKIKSDTGGER